MSSISNGRQKTSAIFRSESIQEIHCRREIRHATNRAIKQSSAHDSFGVLFGSVQLVDDCHRIVDTRTRIKLHRNVIHGFIFCMGGLFIPE